LNLFTTYKALTLHIKSNSFNRIGLVPTMGSLHEGHLGLIIRAIKQNDIVIVTIFINPTQFDDKLDFIKYPKNIDGDLKKIRGFNSNILVYSPNVEDLYNTKIISKKFDFNNLDKIMEGKYRKSHFNGVATIVYKLLSVFKPTNAYFGEKDYQQLIIIKALVLQKKIKTKIISCKTIRNKNGLALSSRNLLLTNKETNLAPIIYKTLKKVKSFKNKMSQNEILVYVKKIFHDQNEFKLEYFKILNEKKLTPVDNLKKEKKLRAFIAVRLGKIRLIDNIKF